MTLTIADVANVIPPNLKSSVTQKIVDDLNNIALDPEQAQLVRDNYITHAAILRDGRFKLDEYFNAVMYVSFKLMGYNNEESYARVFPQRYAQLKARNLSQKDISAYVAGFNKGKLVNLVLEQTIIPHHVLYQDVFQKAVMTQFDLMQNAQSEKVRTEAANSLLTHLKKPETKQVDLNLNVNESSGLKEMHAAITDLAKAQKEAIDAGNLKTIDITSSKLAIQDQ